MSWPEVKAWRRETRQKLLAAVGRNITFRANGCIAIVEAVAQKKVDAALGWTAFLHLSP